MQHIKDAKITGDEEHVKKLRETFADFEFGGLPLSEIEIELQIARVFPNYYRSEDPEEDDALLYVVVPIGKNIERFWPKDLNDIDDTRYCTAYNIAKEIQNIITPAFAVSKGATTLYLCLSPFGVLIDNFSMLGLQDLRETI